MYLKKNIRVIKEIKINYIEIIENFKQRFQKVHQHQHRHQQRFLFVI
jgi:hypothetical protein